MVVADFEAGVGTLTRLGEEHVDTVVIVVEATPKSLEVGARAAALAAERTVARIVVEPTAKSLLSGRRLARMADLDPENPKKVMVVASKVREEGDVEMIAKGTGLEVIASVPWDEELAEAERRQLAPIDFAPDSPAVRAVESLAERLSEEKVA